MAHALLSPGRRVVDSRFFWVYHLFGLVVNSGDGLMAAPKGNRFWEARSSHGRNPKFDDPDVLRDACYQYFEWVEQNPLWEMKAFAYQGVVIQEPVAKMRAMTLSGLCLFICISEDTWATYRKKEDFLGVCIEVERQIYNQKFSGASADLLNASIIARDLGLADKKELTGANGDPIKVESMNPEDAYKAMLEGGALSK